MDLPAVGRLPKVRPMKGYGQFCPVAVAAEIFAERWTPLILRELEDTGVIVSAPLTGGRGREYRLTKAGEEFREVVERLGEWGQRHAAHQFAPNNLDPASKSISSSTRRSAPWPASTPAT